MAGAPGQRAAQQPLRAAQAAQRALGAAVAPDGGVPARAVGVALINGTYYDVTVSPETGVVLTPRDPAPAVAAPDEADELAEQEPDFDIKGNGGGRDGCSADG